MSVQSFRDLLVWQRGMAFVDRCYEITEDFPKSQMYTLTNQIQRAAVSVPSNIAEGAGRGHTREFIQHLYIARGSIFECATQLEIAARRGYMPIELTATLLTEADEIGRMLFGLINSLERKLDSP